MADSTERLAVGLLAFSAIVGSSRAEDDPPEEPPDDPTPTTHTIEICESNGTRVDYKLVANNIEAVSGTLESGDDTRTADNAYEGLVWGACDSFTFTGQAPQSLSWQGGQLDVTIDGNAVDLDSVPWADGPTGAGPSPGDTRGPPAGYTLAFEDQFNGPGLDTSKWSTGFGWGNNSSYTPSTATSGNVNVGGGTLTLQMERHGFRDYTCGAINTKNKFTFGPGTFMQARIRAANLPSCNNAWWAKPNTEHWPPELDMVEIPTHKVHRSMHNLHFDHTLNCSPAPADNHGKTSNGTYNPPNEPGMAARFFNYEVLWERDRVVTWVDGNHVGTTTHTKCLNHFAKCAPFYMMINNIAGHHGWFGYPENVNWNNYRTKTECEYVRMYTQ